MGIGSFKYVILVLLVAFSVLILSNTALAALSLNVSVTPAVVQPNLTSNSTAWGWPNTQLRVVGSVTTDASDTIARVNVSATIGSNGNWNITPSSGFFDFNVSAPSIVGQYTFNVSTNSSSLPNKTFHVFVGNTTSAAVGFIGRFPPFVNGTTFTINVTMFNGTAGLSGYKPFVQIFQANGQNVSWTVTPVNSSLGSNSSQVTNSTGSIAFNVTIPSDATVGEYGVSVDDGIAFAIFRVGSNYQIAVNTLTTSDEVTSNFAPGSTVTVLTKLRANSAPVTGATVTAVITYPNGTTTKNITLSAHPSSDGFYNNTFSDTSVGGQYNIRVGALHSSNNIIGSTTFNTKSFEGRIEPVKEFFFEWGGKSSFKPGQTVALNLVTVNLSSGNVMSWNSCTGGNYTLLGIKFVNGTNSTLGNASITLATDQYLTDTTVCRLSFSAPTEAGTYNIRVNVTNGTDTQTTEGFFSVSNHFLKVTPVLDVGGFEGFTSVVSPGTNITLRLSAINVSGNTAVNPQNITVAVVTRILPLEFTTGASEITTINQTAYNGINGVIDPNITFTLPDTVIGPLMIEVRATLNSSANATSVVETTTGTGFLIANYLSGFLGPQKGSGLPTHEGEGSGDFNADAQCSGTQTFAGSVTDTNTSTAAQGAVVVGIIQAREESTGKDISSSLSVVNTSSSNSNGQISINVSFSSSLSSGNYFVIFNATYKGKYTGIPAFFMCRTLNLGFPQIKVVGSNQQFSWQVSPTSGLNVTLTNVAHMNGSLITNTSTFQSVFSLTQIFNFNPSTGTMKILKNNTPIETTFTNNSAGTSNSATLTIYPQNYSLGGTALSKWPNGFFDLHPRVVSNYGTDNGFGGFMVVAFDAFPEFSFGQSYVAGSTQSIVVRAATNVSNFTISMGRPWEGQLVNVTLVHTPDTGTRLLQDGWNDTSNTGNFSTYGDAQFCPNPQSCAGPYERWNVTFIVPSALRKGGTMLSIKTISNATGLVGESVEVPLFVTVSKFNVILPNEEMVGATSSPMDIYFVKSNAHPGLPDPTDSLSTFGVNLTAVASTASGMPNINSTSGRVCIKTGLNSTRLSGGMQTPIPIYPSGNSTHFNRTIVIDRYGAYDTIIVNRTIGGTSEIIVLNSTQRNFTIPTGAGGLYLWEIKDCSFFTVVNVTTTALLGQGGFISNTAGGSKSVNSYFTIPYVIISAGAPQNNVPVSIKSIAKQDSRGFGFEGKLTTSQFSASGANTNADGIAFVNVSVSTSGRMIAFWATTVSGESDSADMTSATTFDVKAFSVTTQSFTPLVGGSVTLTNDTALNTFNGTVTESADGDFVQDGSVSTWRIVHNITSNKTVISTSAIVNTLQGTLWNSSIPAGSVNLKIGQLVNGTSANNFSKTVVFYTDTSGQNTFTVFNATQNISAVVCVTGFERPTGRPLENATLNVSVRDWSSFPPSTKYLDIFKFSDGSQADDRTNPALTSPSGCVAVRIGPGIQLGSWPSASAGRPPVFIEGTLTKGSTTENLYVGDVFRP